MPFPLFFGFLGVFHGDRNRILLLVEVCCQLLWMRIWCLFVEIVTSSWEIGKVVRTPLPPGGMLLETFECMLNSFILLCFKLSQQMNQFQLFFFFWRGGGRTKIEMCWHFVHNFQCFIFVSYFQDP